MIPTTVPLGRFDSVIVVPVTERKPLDPSSLVGDSSERWEVISTGVTASGTTPVLFLVLGRVREGLACDLGAKG